MNTLNTPKDLPIGTILVQHWCNSVSLYKVIKTSEKSVTLVEMPKKRTHFENEGGCTGYQYYMPDAERLEALEKKYEAVKSEYGFDPLSNKATQRDFQNAHLKAEAKGKHFFDDFSPISNNRSSLVPKRIMAKPAKNGGFYLPGVVKGSFCGNLAIWNGQEVSAYYA